MDNMTIIAAASIISAGLTMGIGAMGPGMGQGLAVAAALSALAQQPEPLQPSHERCLWGSR